MNIYSWNVYIRNRSFDAVFEKIRQLEFDVLCLQEVPDVLLEKLHALPYNLASAIDSRGDGANPQSHVVLMTPHTIVRTETLSFQDPPQPLHSRLFMAYMHLWGWRYLGGRESLWADIVLPDIGEIRVFSLHIGLFFPATRRREFDLALSHADASKPAIVCGDFNILETCQVMLLNWLRGGSLRSVFSLRKERGDMEERFAEVGLQNPLRGIPTQTTARSQLDHILIPRAWQIKHAAADPNRCGSDHKMVFVEAVVT